MIKEKVISKEQMTKDIQELGKVLANFKGDSLSNFAVGYLGGLLVDMAREIEYLRSRITGLEMHETYGSRF